LIRRLLGRLEKNPSAVFAEGELRRQDPEQFERIKDEGLIRRVPDLDESVVDAGRLLTVCANPDGTLEALDDEDVEFDPIESSAGSWVRWRLDLAAYADRFREVNSLAGVHGPLTSRLYLLGETSPVEAIVLALLVDGASGLPLLRSLPQVAPSAYERFLVLTPSLPIPARDMRSLEALGIFLAQLNAAAPFAMPNRAARERRGLFGDQPAFEHSPDYTWIKLDREVFLLPDTAAAIAKVLHEAHLAGRPYLRWPEIVTEIYASPKSMHDAFKTVRNWKALIVLERRRYRLNL